MAMHLYGDFTHAHLCRRLFVQQTGNDECHHLAFTFGERLKPDLQIVQVMILNALRAVALESRLHRVQQILLTKRLGQEFDRAGLYRSHRHRYIAVSGDKNYRCLDLRPG